MRGDANIPAIRSGSMRHHSTNEDQRRDVVAIVVCVFGHHTIEFRSWPCVASNNNNNFKFNHTNDAQSVRPGQTRHRFHAFDKKKISADPSSPWQWIWTPKLRMRVRLRPHTASNINGIFAKIQAHTQQCKRTFCLTRGIRHRYVHEDQCRVAITIVVYLNSTSMTRRRLVPYTASNTKNNFKFKHTHIIANVRAVGPAPKRQRSRNFKQRSTQR